MGGNTMSLSDCRINSGCPICQGAHPFPRFFAEMGGNTISLSDCRINNVSGIKAKKDARPPACGKVEA
jgi:hypothetical protein